MDTDTPPSGEHAAATCRFHDDVDVAHAKRLIKVYGPQRKDPSHPWFLEWAECIVRVDAEVDKWRSIADDLAAGATDALWGDPPLTTALHDALARYREATN